MNSFEEKAKKVKARPRKWWMLAACVLLSTHPINATPFVHMLTMEKAFEVGARGILYGNAALAYKCLREWNPISTNHASEHCSKYMFDPERKLIERTLFYPKDIAVLATYFEAYIKSYEHYVSFGFQAAELDNAPEKAKKLHAVREFIRLSKWK